MDLQSIAAHWQRECEEANAIVDSVMARLNRANEIIKRQFEQIERQRMEIEQLKGAPSTVETDGNSTCGQPTCEVGNRCSGLFEGEGQPSAASDIYSADETLPYDGVDLLADDYDVNFDAQCDGRAAIEVPKPSTVSSAPDAKDEPIAPSYIATRKFTVAQRMAMVKYATEIGSVPNAAKHFNVAGHNLRRWRRLHDKNLAALAKRTTNLKGEPRVMIHEGRQPQCPSLERQLFAWLAAEERRGVPIERADVRSKAKEFTENNATIDDGKPKSNYADLKMSNVWVNAVLRRYKNGK